MKKILIVCPYPEGKAPSQRFRFEQYLRYLGENGLKIKIASFWNEKQWPAIYGDVSIGYKVLSTVFALVKRFLLLFSLLQFDTIFIHREVTPIGPPWWEWCAAKVFGKRIIYDFDDAIWLPNSSKSNAKLVANLKNHKKTAKIISWSETVFAGNSFLAEYASRFCHDVMIVPTTINTEMHKPKIKLKTEDGKGSIPTRLSQAGMTSKMDKSEIYPVSVIGWTGTHSTLKQLEPLFPLLEKVYSQYPFRFLLIADIPPDGMPDFVEFRKWNKETEISDLLEIDIGIMPLYNTDWERGKCGFKALQYMALEIPAVVSAIGVNTEIVEEGLNGYLCEPISNKNPDSYPKWEKHLKNLILDQDLRIKLGRAGRETILSDYSLVTFKQIYLETLIRS